MANFLPFLLIGGGIAVATVASGKKKGRYKFEHLRVGPGCKTIFVNGDDLVAQARLIQDGDEEVRAKVLEDVKLFWLEDMPGLIEKVQPDEEDLERGAEQLVKASLPSCYRPKKAMLNSLKKHMKEAKGAADLEKRLMPTAVRYVVFLLIYAGYQVNLIRDGKMDGGDLSDFQKELAEVGMGEEAPTSKLPTDPNQMAAQRPDWLTEAALQATETRA